MILFCTRTRSIFDCSNCPPYSTIFAPVHSPHCFSLLHFCTSPTQSNGPSTFVIIITHRLTPSDVSRSMNANGWEKDRNGRTSDIFKNIFCRLPRPLHTTSKAFVSVTSTNDSNSPLSADLYMKRVRTTAEQHSTA